jgi:hypothetical protein
MTFHCCDPRRREIVKLRGSANGIDFLEVLDLASPPGAPRQQTLLVRLLRPGFALTPDNIRITGGERIREVGVLWCAAADNLPSAAEAGLVDTVDAADRALTLAVRTDSAGDFSTYALGIFANSGSDQPPDGFDPVLSSIRFSFKVECPSPYDCAEAPVCPPEVRDQPNIDYLAKDYQGFRRLMLDRLSLLVPGWTERSGADIGIALLELLAYAADNLSYRQDVIAGEAYLSTARQRVSIRRHARLVDYFMHEGCNARAFVHFEVTDQDIALPKRTQLLTRVPDLPTVVEPASRELREAIEGGAQVFETAHDAVLDDRLNRFSFYTWGDAACCLPRGATRATLREHHPSLAAGTILMFEEVVSPTTPFVESDADRAHRWAVRLSEDPILTEDPSGQLFDDPPVDGPVEVTEIVWDAADALPFPLCISVEERPGLEVSVALGNIVLADCGLSVADEPLGTVPKHHLETAPPAPAGCCGETESVPVPPRFRPELARAPLTHGFDLDDLLAVPISADELWWPASSLLAIDPRAATPRIGLDATLGTISEGWEPRRDLIASGTADPHFVVEVENSGRVRLRFGDDDSGKRPDPGTELAATYRVGNGEAGNVGAESIAHIVTAIDAFDAVRNPMPAAGGVGAEDVEAVRRDAPQAFRTQERAVTAADYAAAAERRPDVQRAAATFRWTGSWHTVFVTPDRFGGGPVDAIFRTRLRRHLERFRMAGYDLEITAPRYVPLDIALHICVAEGYFRSDVRRAVERALSSQVLPDGRLGHFHPDNFTFGEAVYLSQVIAAAQSVEGVDSVGADRFQRMVDPDPVSLTDAVIPIGGLEIAQLANNPNFRERGKLELTAGGGQ